MAKYRVSGEMIETGEEVTVIVDAASPTEAVKVANRMGVAADARRVRQSQAKGRKQQSALPGLIAIFTVVAGVIVLGVCGGAFSSWRQASERQAARVANAAVPKPDRFAGWTNPSGELVARGHVPPAATEPVHLKPGGGQAKYPELRLISAELVGTGEGENPRYFGVKARLRQEHADGMREVWLRFAVTDEDGRTVAFDEMCQRVNIPPGDSWIETAMPVDGAENIARVAGASLWIFNPSR